MTLYAELVKRSGKSYTIENCHWGRCTDSDDSSCPTSEWCPFNWFRTSGDINDGSTSWLSNLQTTRRFQDWEKPLSVPGCWAYPDMLEVGRVQAPAPGTFARWNRAHFGAWCIISAPLILGLELSDAQLEPVLDFIGNAEALAVNQAWAGHPGLLVAEIQASGGRSPELQTWATQQRNKPAGRAPSVELAASHRHGFGVEATPEAAFAAPMPSQLWAKPLPGGGAAALLINTSPRPLEYRLQLATLNLTAPTYHVRDIWQRTGHSASPVAAGLELAVPPYDSAFLLFTPATAP